MDKGGEVRRCKIHFTFCRLVAAKLRAIFSSRMNTLSTQSDEGCFSNDLLCIVRVTYIMQMRPYLPPSSASAADDLMASFSTRNGNRIYSRIDFVAQ